MSILTKYQCVHTSNNKKERKMKRYKRRYEEKGNPSKKKRYEEKEKNSDR